MALLVKGLTTNSAPEHKNKYLYQGKEMQDEHGVNWLDFGARMYDANLGRWFAPDPLLLDARSLEDKSGRGMLSDNATQANAVIGSMSTMVRGHFLHIFRHGCIFS